MENKKLTISHETLERYVSGKADLSEIAQVSAALQSDEDLRSLVDIMEGLHTSGSLYEDSGEIPMASMAAMAEGNLCDVMCEQYILKDYLENPSDDYSEEMLDNCWLKEAGTPLHNMGKLLEKHGMSVDKRFDCSIDDIANLLSDKRRLIAVVDYGQLWNGLEDGIFHAVVCLSLVDGILRIYDPAIDGCSNYDVNAFARAWKPSKNYLVTASAEKLEYRPHPIDVSDIELDDQLIELTEAIAENAHEIWASKRRSEGWTFGPERNDSLLQHPDMIPYSELTESEKYYDRAMALNTIKLVKKLGFRIDRKFTRYCDSCGEFVADSMTFCPNCGAKLKQD